MAGRGELEWIAQVRRSAATRSAAVRLSIGDDCAVLRPSTGHDVLVTTDFSLEGVHFRRDWHPARSAGHRCLARGLSDLAAMGAKPMGAFLSLALPAHLRAAASGKRWVDGFLEGLLALAKSVKTPLAGGDTAAAPGEAVLADIVLLGSAPRGTELRRSGARPGDALYITGGMGGAAAEFLSLSQRPARFRRATAESDHPHLFPAPRLAVGDTLRRRRLATACIDLSDGLSTDLRHLCEESNVGALVDADALPLHPLLQAQEKQHALSMALHGGEDYELLFTAAPGTRVPQRIAGVAVTRIGTMTRGSDVMLQQHGHQTPLHRGGWEHTL